MIGRRVRGATRFLPGDYGQHAVDGQWYACTPNGHLAGLKHHAIDEHPDGTISVHPSIEISGHINGSEEETQLWHGHLERGVWREVA